jgi:glutaminyl-tRNA synthetase
MTEYAPDPGAETGGAKNFIRDIIEEDLATDKYGGRVVTRFPPEPNGYLHIGHAKSICLNFGLAADYNGLCNLRFDDTNPETEDPEYVAAIIRDVKWLGFDWDDRLFFASDYFEQLYECALKLIRDGKAFVDSQSDDEIRRTRGTVTEPGVASPYRDRSIEDNLDLFQRMRAGEFADGEHVLRAKIDMTSKNMKLRDPLLYRIRHAHHYRRGDDWCIYPMYDYAHPLSDAIEGITHSICTLEFDNNRALYDWVLDNAWTTPRPHQYEFNRLNLSYTVMSKRKLLQLVQDGLVDGWDDPRLPTIAALRRRGVTPEAIRDLCSRVGVVKTDTRVDVAQLEYSIRNDLNYRAPRVMAVLNPLRVVITNYPEGEEEWLDASYWPHDVPKEGARKVPFSRVLYIERDDFMEHPSRKFYRLAPGREVRLRYAYFITCDEVVKNPETGEIEELRCTYDAATKGGDAPDGRKVKGTLHWVSADHSLPAEGRLYDRLFGVAGPEDAEEDWKGFINPGSKVVLTDAQVEPSVVDDPADTRYQFERQGYFWQDPEDSSAEHLVFNRIVTLRDSWAKISRETDEAQLPGATDTGEATDAPGEMDRSDRGAADSPVEEKRLPKLNARRRERADRYESEHELAGEDAVLLSADDSLASFFEQAVGGGGDPRSVANWILHELLRELKGRRIEDLSITPGHLVELLGLLEDDTISGRIAKNVFAATVETGERPGAIVESRGLRQVTDEETLGRTADQILESHPDKVATYREGKKGLIGFFVGQVMKETRGKANPEIARRLLEERLS